MCVSVYVHNRMKPNGIESTSEALIGGGRRIENEKKNNKTKQQQQLKKQQKQQKNAKFKSTGLWQLKVRKREKKENKKERKKDRKEKNCIF